MGLPICRVWTEDLWVLPIKPTPLPVSELLGEQQDRVEKLAGRKGGLVGAARYVGRPPLP